MVVPLEAAAGSFLRDTVTVFREARGEAEVRPRPGMTAADVAARRRRILARRGCPPPGSARPCTTS
ncbi:hypothetical protein GXW82_40240 [Streptacidiphilus sp. 4-A2]|nr:hypothetical protein [Streptacidiphilus sp. 4-A2]